MSGGFYPMTEMMYPGKNNGMSYGAPPNESEANSGGSDRDGVFCLLHVCENYVSSILPSSTHVCENYVSSILPSSTHVFTSTGVATEGSRQSKRKPMQRQEGGRSRNIGNLNSHSNRCVLAILPV